MGVRRLNRLIPMHQLNQRQTHRFINPIQLLHHLVIPKPQHLKPLRNQKRITCLIARGICMLPTIDLDHQLVRETDKINNILTNRRLPAKFDTHLLRPKILPNRPLRFGHISAQGTGVFDE